MLGVVVVPSFVEVLASKGYFIEKKTTLATLAGRWGCVAVGMTIWCYLIGAISSSQLGGLGMAIQFCLLMAFFWIPITAIIYFVAERFRSRDVAENEV